MGGHSWQGCWCDRAPSIGSMQHNVSVACNLAYPGTLWNLRTMQTTTKLPEAYKRAAPGKLRQSSRSNPRIKTEAPRSKIKWVYSDQDYLLRLRHYFGTDTWGFLGAFYLTYWHHWHHFVYIHLTHLLPVRTISHWNTFGASKVLSLFMIGSVTRTNIRINKIKRNHWRQRSGVAGTSIGASWTDAEDWQHDLTQKHPISYLEKDFDDRRPLERFISRGATRTFYRNWYETARA